MTRRNPNRPRRTASPRTIRLLRLLGWRWSSTRQAWVHHAFRGRVGPVFVDQDFHPQPELTDLSIFEAPRAGLAVLLAPVEERPPLPRRDPSPTPRAARVFTRLSDGEEPRVIVVDGRPPVRGTVLPAPVAEGVVVPIKSARATG